jgi:hypothetical protein
VNTWTGLIFVRPVKNLKTETLVAVFPHLLKVGHGFRSKTTGALIIKKMW